MFAFKRMKCGKTITSFCQFIPEYDPHIGIMICVAMITLEGFFFFFRFIL